MIRNRGEVRWQGRGGGLVGVASGAMRCLRTRAEVLLNTPIWATRKWGKCTGKDQTNGGSGGAGNSRKRKGR